MTQRQEKVNSLIKRCVSEYLLRERFEEITGLVTVTGADVSADLEHVKVYVSVIGQREDEVMAILKKKIYEIQGAVNKSLVMRKLPRIHFELDRSGEYAAHISKIIKEL